MELNDLLAQGQPEACATFLASDLDERFEDPPLLAIGDTFAVVFDADDHPFTVAPALQADLTVVAGVAHGIVDQAASNKSSMEQGARFSFCKPFW